VIRLLDLKPHPEGGHFRETFRDERKIDDKRSVSTAIYFVLQRGERSHWHRVDAVEVWHFHAGSPLALQIANTSGIRTLRLGADLAAGERAWLCENAWWESTREGVLCMSFVIMLS